MAYAHTAIAPRDLHHTEPKTGRGVLRRLLDAMTASRTRQAEREIARYLAHTGGKFTDESEREIERRFLSSPPSW
jgi:hypothetical protein